MSRHRSTPAALAALRRDERRQLAAAEARALRDDPDDLAVVIGDRETLVMCDQLDTVDPNRLTEPAGFLSMDEMNRVDEALTRSAAARPRWGHVACPQVADVISVRYIGPAGRADATAVATDGRGGGGSA